MEHWLPLLEEKLATLFDHLGDHDVIIRDLNTDGALEARHEAIEDYFANREKAMVVEPGSYRPLAPLRALFVEQGMASRDRRAADPPHDPLPAASEATRSSISASRGRETLRRSGRRTSMSMRRWDTMSPSCATAEEAGGPGELHHRRRERLAGLLEDHGLKSLKLAKSWQDALGPEPTRPSSCCRSTMASMRLEVAVLTEQDMLGDRLVRRKKRRKSADAFLAELAALTPGDLVVHMEHGIGRYEG